MTDQTAFRSDKPQVLDTWAEYVAACDDVRERRNAMTERYGRRLMLNRLGFGHGTRVTGFERLEGDEPGALIGERGELRVPKRGGDYTAVPNLARKAGRDLAAELGTLEQEGPRLPGMPGFALAGLHALAPALFEHDGAVYALWGADITDNGTGGELDLDTWERIPLSTFYAADEARKDGAA